MSEQKTQFLTPQGKEKLERELEFLRTVRRAEIAEHLKSAVEEGDLTENAGYDEAKREQAFVEGRIREVEALLHNSRLLDVHVVAADSVSVGSRVTVIEHGGGSPETYHIVGSAESDPLKGRISHESPLGRALLGKQVGDTIPVHTPGGVLRFEIMAIG
ncbi:MAG: transcription elongation factor GreA [Chloroflexi bacterium]|nr:transcription elongation factor GreA [Chloroflexota bacterium]